MIAFDTNILLYAYDRRDPAKLKTATDLIRSTADGVLFWQVAVEFLSSSRKLEKFGLSIDDAWRHLTDLRRLFPLVMPTPGALARTQSLMTTHQIHFWDALIFAACLEQSISRIYSEDLPGQAIDGLEVINPFA
jgi:predicted nucleic acid-binding protein